MERPTSTRTQHGDKFGERRTATCGGGTPFRATEKGRKKGQGFLFIRKNEKNERSHNSWMNKTTFRQGNANTIFAIPAALFLPQNTKKRNILDLRCILSQSREASFPIPLSLLYLTFLYILYDVQPHEVRLHFAFSPRSARFFLSRKEKKSRLRRERIK